MKIIKRTKYNVDKDKIKRTFDGIVFDSEMEMRFYEEFVLPRMRSGEILSCERQVEFELQPKFKYHEKTILAITYLADFVITFQDGKEIIYETKGFSDSVAKIKAKMFRYKYPEKDYRWVCYSMIDSSGCDDGWVLYDIVQKGRAERKKKKKNKLLSEDLNG